MASPLDLLRSVFGYNSFRGEQADVISHVAGGGDALVLMPTGGGKSLCYQIPALLRDGVGIVVSPLIALMQDQVEALRQLGVRAAAINSTCAFAEVVEIERQMRSGEIDLVYVAPERLLTDNFLNQLGHCRLALFAIDEAHCVSQWGHDFRPEYIQLAVLAERFPGVPRIALTATADQATRREIAERLRLEQGRVFIGGFDRPNIRYRVLPKDNPRRQLLAFLKEEHPADSGIVYCLSRNKVDETAEWLRQEGFDALPYHAGLDKGIRAANQDRFLKGEGIVMVATIAFGMGIDKPDVRFVAHLDLPKSLEAYYQETGRAGRDGLPADAWMVYGMADVAKVRQMIEGSDSPPAQKAVERRKLDALLGYCETTRCRRQVLLEYFSDQGAPCGNCDTCLEPVEAFDGTQAAQKALSCVYRTGQVFGAGHVIDVLMGVETERVRTLNHTALSTFGIGAEHGKDSWKSIFRQLVAFGLLVPDMEHGSLRLSESSRTVLRGEQQLMLRRDPKPAGRKGRTGTKGKAAASMLADPSEQALFEALRATRRELAQAQGVPPYVIFHDATLVEMARLRPVDIGDFARVPGVGESKLARYAEPFLAVLQAHAA